MVHGGQRAHFLVSMGGPAACTCLIEPARWTGCTCPVEPARRTARTHPVEPAWRTSRTRPRLIKQLHASHWVWLNIDMAHIIQPFVILTCQLIVSKRTSLATNVCASSQTRRFFYHAIYVPCHETMPSFMFLGEFLIYWDLKTEILNVLGRRQVCNSFSFLQ